MAVLPETQKRQTSQDQPLVWIFVLHYQAPEETKTCLTSLRALQYPNFRILLLDNGSPDRSGDAIASEFPDIEYLRLEENLGFAGGCNAGVTYCVERGAKWVWLLNNDTRAATDSLDILMSQALSAPQAGLLGAQVYTPHGDGFVPSGLGEIDFLRGKSLMRKRVPEQGQAVSCEWLSGCNLLLRTDAFLSVGGFDEDYFLYFEDTDLCYRMRKAGWDCLLVPKARVEHIGGASTEGKMTTWRAYYYTRNRLLFFLRYSQGIGSLPLTLAIFAHIARHALVLPFRGEKGRRQLKAELLGLQDYVFGRLGKANCLDW